MYNVNIGLELSFANLTSSTSYFDRQTACSEETSPRFSAGLRGLVNAAACFGAVPGCGPGTLASMGGDGIFYRAFGEKSAFGEVGYRLSEEWEVLVGARYA